MAVFLLLAACSTPTPSVETQPPVPEPAAADAEEEGPAPESETRERRGARNHTPVITEVLLSPTSVRAADALRAIVTAHDSDGDELSYDYTWLVDDERLPQATGERLPSGNLKKGATVRVRVTARDGNDEADALSEALIVENTPPVFRTQPRDLRRVDRFAFQADDADGDALTWRLEGAPAGMSISPKGVLTYQGSEQATAGDYTVAVIVDDGEAWGRFEFPISVSAGSAAKPAPE